MGSLLLSLDMSKLETFSLCLAMPSSKDSKYVAVHIIESYNPGVFECNWEMAGVLAVCFLSDVSFYTVHYYFHLLSCNAGLGKFDSCQCGFKPQ